jgi:hypothetical protein
VRGYTPEVFDGRLVIGIANSWSSGLGSRDELGIVG